MGKGPHPEKDLPMPKTKPLHALAIALGLAAGTFGVHAFADDKPAAPAAGTGSIKGTVTIEGKAESRKYKFEETVVSLVGEELDKLSAPVPTEPAVMDQNGIAYIPTVLAIRAGTTVLFKNNDPTQHNVHCTCTANKPMNQGMNAGEKCETKFEKPEVVEVTCNIHAAMHAFIVVLPNSFFAKCEPTGEFKLPNVPAGTWKIKAWHDGMAPVNGTVTVKAGEEASATLDLVPKKRGR